MAANSTAEYICNDCKSHVEAGGRCTVCDDLNLCVKEMQELGLEQREDEKQMEPQESRGVIIRRCILSLEHACKCGDANCLLKSCPKMKRIVSHAKTCFKRKVSGDCAICEQLIALTCYHAKECKDEKCALPFCLSIKYKLEQHRMAQKP